MTDNKNTNTNGSRKEVRTYRNYDIFPGKVRVVGDDGPKIMDRDAAINLAQEQGMDLVQIAYNKTDYPRSVCKIMNYGKFIFDQKKKEKEAKKKARESIAEVKEIGFTIRTDDGDKVTKINHIRRIISEGDKVSIFIKLNRREMNMLGMAKDIMRDILSQLDGIVAMESNPSFMSGILACTIRPLKNGK